MKKKLISLTLFAAMVLSLAACGSTQSTATASSSEPAAASTSAAASSSSSETEEASSETSVEADSTEAVSDITVYKNGNIYTSNENQDYVTAVVVQDGKFIYVGDDEGAAAYEEGLPEENIIDLDGSLVTSGLIEGHTHFTFMAAMNSLGYIEIAAGLDLDGALDALKEFIAEHPDYDQYAIGNFSQTFDLDKTQLDEICPDKPLICVGMGLHCGYVNSAFLEAGGIDKDTTDAVPGESYYERDEEGNPTGKIVELTQTWIAFEKAIKLDNEKVKEEILNMQELYHSYGFTGIAEGGFLGLNEEDMLQNYVDLEDEDELELVVCPASIWYGHNVTPLSEIEERVLNSKENYTTALIRPGTVKMWADGTIGALSALMSEPYDVEGDEEIYGVQLNTVEDLTACAEMCKENDINIHYHAIGDQAIKNVLTAFEAVGETTGTKSIVHFQISTPELIERASKIDGLIINMTPLWSNTLTKEEVDPVGERRDTYGLFKETMDAGLTVNFGADSNGVKECWNPMNMILVAMNRNPDEEGVFLKGEACSFEEAVDAYTINVAKERRIEDEYGSIEVGKNACLTIWNVDNLTKELYNEYVEDSFELTDDGLIYADYVIFNGELVYKH